MSDVWTEADFRKNAFSEQKGDGDQRKSGVNGQYRRPSSHDEKPKQTDKY